jgi:hypothetical protein
LSLIGLVCLLSIFKSCIRKYDLRDTKWLTVKFTIDSLNYLTDFEKAAYSTFDTSTKLYSEFYDNRRLTFVEGHGIDTSQYKIARDTLFTIQDTRRDTSIILKLTMDSLIEQRLAGVKAYSIRFQQH